MSIHKFALHRKRLWKLLAAAPAKNFFIMIWAIDALVSGRSRAIGNRFFYPQSALNQEPGSPFYAPQWELETLVNEYLALRQKRSTGPKVLNCSHWKAFATVRNALHGLENVESTRDIEEGRVTEAIPRMIWRQFPWQIGFVNAQLLFRAWFLYNFIEANEHFENKYEISIEKFTIVGFAVFASLEKFPAALGNQTQEDLSISEQDCEAFFKIASRPLRQSRLEAKELRRGPGMVAYKPSILRQAPLIEISSRSKSEHFAPLRDLVICRITEGLFFDLVDNDNVRRIMGKRFEEYVKLILDHYAPSDFHVKEEFQYNNVASPDLLVRDQNEEISLVVECKAKRISMKIRQSAAPFQENQSAYEELAKGIFQVWKFCADVRLNKVPGNVRVATGATGVIVTLEPWMQLSSAIMPRLFSIAREMAASTGYILEADMIPVAFIAMTDFESCLGRANFEDVLAGLKKMTEEQYHGYLLHSIMRDMRAGGELSDAVPTPFAYYENLSEVVEWWDVLNEVAAESRA